MLTELKADLVAGKDDLLVAIEFVKATGSDYMDLTGRKIVDSAIAILVGHLLLGQAAANERKQRVARRFIDLEMSRLRMNCELITSGDTAPLDEYELLAGPVPPKD